MQDAGTIEYHLRAEVMSIEYEVEREYRDDVLLWLIQLFDIRVFEHSQTSKLNVYKGIRWRANKENCIQFSSVTYAYQFHDNFSSTSRLFKFAIHKKEKEIGNTTIITPTSVLAPSKGRFNINACLEN